jgi:ABC-type uncharacterized transport system involved in gliding motility auxiliary subunit
MERLKRILGPLGLALILAGGITYGILYSSGWLAVVPLVAGILLVAASAALNFRGARSEGSRRSARFGINAAVSIIAFAAILVFLQTLASRHGASFDSTANKRFSLSSQTVKILDRLAKDVVFTCFFKPDAPDRTALSDLLREYAGENPRVKYSFVDPDKDPVTARRYRIRSYGTIVAESGGNEEQFTQITEEKLTNAILKVTRTTKKIICVLTGHGEKSIDDAEPTGLDGLKSSLEAEGYAIRNLLTLRDSIPPDCAILLIPGPEKDIYASERGMIERYLSEGGSVLVLIDPLVDLPQIESVAAGYGIEVTRSIVVDRFARLVSGNYLTPVVNQYGNHPITDGFKVASFFPQARALAAAKDKPPGVEIEVLASTGASTFGETNLADVLKGKTQYEPDRDLAGPLGVAVVAKREIAPSPARDAAAGGGTRYSRIVVFGDSDFASNAYLGLSGNRDLILNTIGWLAEEEDLIAVRAKDPVNQPVVVNMRQGRTVFWLPVVGLPVIVGCIGVLVLVYRRRSA